MKKNIKSYNNRIIFLLIFFLLMLLAIVVKLFYVHVVKSKEYTKMAIEQINRSEEIVSDRGYIYDRNGKKLAINIPASTIYVNGSVITDTIEREAIAKELAPLLQLEKEELINLISNENRVKVKQWVDSEVALRIREKALNGVEVVDGFRRSYPYGNLASHLLGFANIDGVGQYGIEASYNEELSGNPGRIFKSSDAGNRQLPNKSMEVYDADDGLSAVLTIDQGIQKLVEDESKKIIEEFQADSVQIIVQEVETGDILTMSNYPSFDGNSPTSPINQNQKALWKGMKTEVLKNEWFENWKNPVVSNIYEPGSTFKVITAAAAIEEDVSNPDKHYYCTGYIRDIKNAPVLRYVSHGSPHGDITLREALAYSCNPSFVYLNRDLGRENFIKYVKAFGFGEKTGIDLNGEGLGIIPNNPEGISELSFATMSYGYGIAVTPIQLINAFSAIGNDGFLMKPRVVKELINSEGKVVKSLEISEKRQVISKETSDQVLDMMYSVVETGTASKAKSSIYKIGGKTGTASKVSEDGTGYAEGEYISSFVGLAPIDNPKIAVLVIVDNPKTETYGALVATPSAKTIIEYSLKSMGINETPRELNEETSDFVTMPDLSYKLIGDAGSMLTNLGLKYTTEYTNITDETIVVSQSVEAGELLERGSIVDLKTNLNEGLTKIIPNLTGKKVFEIEAYLNKLQIDYEVKGLEDGIIIDQEPNYGRFLATDKKLVLTLGEKLEVDEGNNEDSGFRDGLLYDENMEGSIDGEDESSENQKNIEKDE